jgi:uncharacterized protein YbjT (DUF2867 family)
MGIADVVVVTGATGLQGGAVARGLLAGGRRVRALTRRPQSAAARRLQSQGAELAAADLDDPASLRAAFAGAQGVFSVQDFWEHGYEREVRQGLNVIAAAEAVGVGHLVYASVGGVGRTEGLGIRHFDSKAEIEAALRGSALGWTVLRPVTFLENFTMEAALQRLFRTGIVTFPYPGDQPFQLLALDDEADLVRAAFEAPELFRGVTLEIASDVRRLDEVAAVISEAAGVRAAFREISLEAFADYVAKTTAEGLAAQTKIGPSLVPQLAWNRAAGGGWQADFAAVRRMHPGLRSVERWAAGVDWAAARQRLGAAAAPAAGAGA